MKTSLAKSTYLILITGLLFIGILLSLIGFQLKELSGDSIYGRLAQMNILQILNDTKQSVSQLKSRLESIPGIEVKIHTLRNTTPERKNIPILYTGNIKPPFHWDKPVLLKHKNQMLLIKFSPFNRITLLTIIYIVVMILLILLMPLLCFWAVRRLEKINLLAIDALAQLSKNIYSQIILPIEHSDAQKLYSYIQTIQAILQQALQKRTHMLAAISHDLKTPITRIKLRAELLDDPNKKSALLADIEQLETMIASILAFSKNFIEEESSTDFDLSELINSIINDLLDIGYQIQAEIQENVIYHGRMMAIKRAVSNLIDNALKYAKDEVKVSLTQTANSIICKIADKGKGIPNDDYEKVFEPFYRIDQSRNQNIPGSGLGLSITKEIIEGHGGNIKLLPNKPSGVIALIQLPR
ncbi:HAMP domain-containing histidine kinase [Thiotrichales bacterium 19S3-7]|nr:HAMP domain-containing histidine kinase [Thiotrichales bacterium 19S3-7]MCF6800590.1 HAMP domain-containing histidine kinase [Thiotrichales bacterium 19S3-11]